MTGKANIRQSTLNVEPWKRGKQRVMNEDKKMEAGNGTLDKKGNES